jgi:hypothetical protein
MTLTALNRQPNFFLTDSNGMIIYDRNRQPIINKDWWRWFERQVESITPDSSFTPSMSLITSSVSPNREKEVLPAPMMGYKQHEESLPGCPDRSKNSDEPIPLMTQKPCGVRQEVELYSDGIIYLGDCSTDGTWRALRSGSDLIYQRKESGSWVTKQTISA